MELVSESFDYVNDRHGHNARAKRRADGVLTFIGVDGEGVTNGDHQDYVLLGVGSNQIEDAGGLSFETIMDFLYSNFRDDSDAVFVGFYLGYDFAMWLRGLPEDRARLLLTAEGKAKRTRNNSHGNPTPFPVRYAGWEFDMLPGRFFRLRPQCCESSFAKGHNKVHKSLPYMYVCDAGAFFQTSLMNAIDPKNWKDDPIVTEAEWRTLQEGKSARGNAILDADMRKYNALENDVLSRLMARQAVGLHAMGIKLHRGQWYGPGQATQVWLDTQPDVKRRTAGNCPNKGFQEIARRTYYGGWFEIFMHGVIPGKSYSYDINSAYPFIMSTLPCLLHGTYRHGRGRTYEDNGRQMVIVSATVAGSDPYCGTMLHRSKTGSISRPTRSQGYYWLSELKAAERAGLIDSIDVKEWWSYDPCQCLPPLRNLAMLYRYRQNVGKNSAIGKAAKLVYNSAYGKFAQAIGSAPYGNWAYASLTTSGCRTMILDAIATHPEGTRALEMVATDGVFFRSPHPYLPQGEELGAWEEDTKVNLCLYKPGVYWDEDSAAKASFKSRGFRASDFTHQIPDVVEKFERLSGLAAQYPRADFLYRYWPVVRCVNRFSITSPKLALARNKWETVAEVHTDITFLQSAAPEQKRYPVPYVDGDILRTDPPDWIDYKSRAYAKHYRDEYDKMREEMEELLTEDGDVAADWSEMMKELTE